MSERLRFRFDREKALEVILYITSRAPIPDKFHICKIVYFADRYHLEHYARSIFGDRYSAMPHGPVPSGTYDLITAAARREVPTLFVDDVNVFALRGPDTNYFSQSDIEALDWAIEGFGAMKFGALRAISHDRIWNATTEHGALLDDPDGPKSIPMRMEDIVSDLNDGPVLLRHLYEY